ncbi:transglutaminase family protein [Reichenbachiella agarivorans]|uniref:Transglutaminase family protein n=1 Tax=Reichenbachiella agarivorans TaxID=2979464 RepID=A0ABY6CKD9_9BACT|nr:transglutaminase family protein [Reichenbachiella agarivorans]UXP30957.1 transglutaminase family protein [Reichenbachiella agarivorans]
MSKYKLTYQTTNSYENIVKEALFALKVIPISNEQQQLLSYSAKNNLCEDFYLQPNLFGFNQLMLRIAKRFDQLDVTVVCHVEVAPINPYQSLDVAVEEEKDLIHSLDFKIDHHTFLDMTPSTFIDLASLPKDLVKSHDQTCESYLKDLNAYIYTQFQFNDDVNSFSNTPQDTFQQKNGVCQDFAQVFIASCRANGIPARYVSGYLNQGAGYVGSAMMHAWVEAFIPGKGWQGYDPTNNLLRDSNYVKVCHGVDYDDCAPIKGILNTHGENQTAYKVEVVQQ